MVQGRGGGAANTCAEDISDGDRGIRKGREVHKSVGTASSWLFPHCQASGMEWREARPEGKQFPHQARLSTPRWRVQTLALSGAVKRAGLPFGYKHASLQICGNSGHHPSPALLPALHELRSREQKAVSSSSLHFKCLSRKHQKSIGTGS